MRNYFTITGTLCLAIALGFVLGRVSALDGDLSVLWMLLGTAGAFFITRIFEATYEAGKKAGGK